MIELTTKDESLLGQEIKIILCKANGKHSKGHVVKIRRRFKSSLVTSRDYFRAPTQVGVCLEDVDRGGLHWVQLSGPTVILSKEI